MPDFIVTVCRTTTSVRDFHVKGAKNAHEAMQTAENQGSSHEFYDQNSDYEAVATVALEKGQFPAANLLVLTPVPEKTE